ncbi:hypothetical protein HanPI659440_Chr03g0135801 [Helianthus annuus]|nr:hypothetical protein HanPI659440_Chr03g0135801 [Helianthus annuus]
MYNILEYIEHVLSCINHHLGTRVPNPISFIHTSTVPARCGGATLCITALVSDR